MSMLQMEFMKMIEGLPDNTMQILLEVVKQVVLPLECKENVGSSSEYQSKLRRIGSLKGQRLISEGYDIDESNAEIAKNVWGRMMKILIDTNIVLDVMLKRMM